MSHFQALSDWLLSFPPLLSLSLVGCLSLLFLLLAIRQIRLVFRIRASHRQFLDELRSQLR
jgi:hypothetical protein